MHESEALPFAIMYSHRGPGDWSDLAIGFAAIYPRLITKNSGLWKPVEAARAASGSEHFTAWLGSQVKATWTEYYCRREAGMSHEAAGEGLFSAPASNNQAN